MLKDILLLNLKKWKKNIRSRGKLIDIEYKLFTKIRDFIEENIDRMQKLQE